MGHSRMVKWLASNLRIGIGVYGDTKAELLSAMRYSSEKFELGDRVMIMRQSSSVQGFSKIIIFGKSWSMPKWDDNEFEERLESSRKEYFQTYKG